MARPLRGAGRRAAVGLGFLLLVVLSCDDGPTEPPVERPIRVFAMRVEPLVSLAGQPLTLEARIRNAGGAEVVELLAGIGGFDWVRLYDDGTHGDAVAGDSIYTTNQIVLPVDATGVGVFGMSHISRLRAVGGPEAEDWRHAKGALRTIDTDVVPVPPIHDLAPDVRATSHVVAMVRDAFDLEAIGARYYHLLPDDRDFLVVVNAAMQVGESLSGMAIHVRQSVQGIGASTGPRSRPFGSEARLQMLVEITRSLFASKPGSGYCLVTHELNHRWAAFTGPPLSSSAHWVLESLARDSSAFGVAGVCLMNDLELYLAGFLPADSVVAPLTASGYGIADIVRVHGERSPDASQAQRDFTVGFIVVYDRPLADHEVALFHHLAREYTAPETDLGFNWADVTGGRSTLDSRLDLPERQPAGQPIGSG
jgi:hypothetical protein